MFLVLAVVAHPSRSLPVIIMTVSAVTLFVLAWNLILACPNKTLLSSRLWVLGCETAALMSAQIALMELVVSGSGRRAKWT